MKKPSKKKPTAAQAKIPTFGFVKEGVKYTERPGAYGLISSDEGLIAVIETSFGFFLPGGGVEDGEDPESALKREIFEEIGYHVIHAELFAQSAQFHWSEYYQEHFKKVGFFYHVEANPAVPSHLQDEHSLHWWPLDLAAKKLSQEFQRWAVNEFVNKPVQSL